MFFTLRVVFTTIFFFITVSLCSAQSNNYEDWIILGVKLGNPLEQAISAIKAVKPDAKIKEHEIVVNGYGVRLPTMKFGASSNVSADKGGTDTITVFTNPLDHELRVFGVTRRVYFKDPISLRSMLASLSEKYGPYDTIASSRYGRGLYIKWLPTISKKDIDCDNLKVPSSSDLEGGESNRPWNERSQQDTKCGTFLSVVLTSKEDDRLGKQDPNCPISEMTLDLFDTKAIRISNDMIGDKLKKEGAEAANNEKNRADQTKPIL